MQRISGYYGSNLYNYIQTSFILMTSTSVSPLIPQIQVCNLPIQLVDGHSFILISFQGVNVKPFYNEN